MSENKTYININAIKDASISVSKLDADIQTSLGKANSALQSYTEKYKGTVTGIKINGSTKSPSNGTVDLGTVMTSSTITWDNNSNMNNLTTPGVYEITGVKTSETDNLPIYNGGYVSARLVVIQNDNCISQILTLLNVGGGDTNIYTRTRQNGSWDMWGKFQTNIEVGLIGVGQSKTFDDFIDNGMYSGVNAYWQDSVNYITGAETFVLVVVNGYLYGAGVTQMKYGIRTDGVKTIQTRYAINRRDDGSWRWGVWQDINSTPVSNIFDDMNETTNIAIEPNTYYTISCGNANISFKSGETYSLNNYMFQISFEYCNSSYPTVSLPASIKWANETPPVFKKGYVYQISVINNLGVFTEFK